MNNSNSQATVPGWMMFIACLLMAAIVSGLIDQTPPSDSPVSNIVAD